MLEFQLLSDNEKITLLYEDGSYIGKRRVNHHVVLLYQFEGFYVEVFYKSYRKFIDYFHCFETTTFLDPYLEEIDVEKWVYS
ncbi:MAG: hypothetical protein ICV65_17120 [Flavisolibacter sp.]|nr:hypothetical protein [Flavisolibacter sp.]